MKKYDLMRKLNSFFGYEPFKMKVEIYHQESKHIAINFYMSLDQSDELINCIENSGEVSIAMLDAISEATRTKKLQLQKDMPVWSNQFAHWDNILKDERR